MKEPMGMSECHNRGEHDWMDRGVEGDLWRECFLCGRQEDAPTQHAADIPGGGTVSSEGDGRA